MKNSVAKMLRTPRFRQLVIKNKKLYNRKKIKKKVIINKQIQFIHIPRTGGRYLNYVLTQNNHYYIHDDYSRKFKGIEIPHLSYPENLNFHYHSFSKRFTIVRNPVDRFISMLRDFNPINEEKIDSIFKNQDSFYEFVNNARVVNLSNWFLPQINFIDHKTKLWKFEDKLENNFFKWLLDNFNLKIIDKDYESVKFKIKSIHMNKFVLNEKQKQYIKNYYYQDYKI